MDPISAALTWLYSALPEPYAGDLVALVSFAIASSALALRRGVGLPTRTSRARRRSWSRLMCLALRSPRSWVCIRMTRGRGRRRQPEPKHPAG